MTNNETRKTNRLLMIAAIVGVCAAAALFAGSIWQNSVEQSKIDEAGSHLVTADLLDDAGVEGQAAAVLLNEYVAAGDAALIPEIQASTAAAVQNLSAGIAEAGEDSNGFLTQGGAAVEALGQVIALRQSGDIAGSIAALEALSPGFAELVGGLEAFSASERESAAAATSSADSADTLASFLAVGAGALAIFMVLVAVAVAGRRLLRRGSVSAPAATR